MNHDEILEMLRRSGVEVPGDAPSGATPGADEPIDVEVEVEDIPSNGTKGSAETGPKTARERKKAARAREKASRGERVSEGRPVPPFMERMARWCRRAFVVLLIALVIALALSYWWFHPALNLHSPRVWSWIILASIFAVVGLKVAALRSARRATLLNRLSYVPLAVILAFFVGLLMGEPFIPGNAERYATVLKTTEGDFAKDIEEVDYADVPVIDRASAQLLGSRAMGSIPEFVSQFEISPAYSQINYQGRPVRVSPLTYADLFKWLSHRGTGIPAYVLVDMVTQEAEVVRLEEPIRYSESEPLARNIDRYVQLKYPVSPLTYADLFKWLSHRGTGIPAYVLVDMVTQEAEVVRLEEPIRYSESEPLARNIDRYVQLKYPTYMFDQKSFELDEDGTPWWVFPVQKRTIGLFEGTTIQRVVLVNACTGETEDYAIGDCPTSPSGIAPPGSTARIRAT